MSLLDKKLRICHVNLAHGFRGGERQTELLVRGLARHGLMQRLVARADSPLRSRLSDLEGLDIRALRRPLLVQPWHTRGVDIVHAHDARAVHYAHVARRLGGPRYVLTRRVPNSPGSNIATRAAYRSADCVIAISNAIASVIRQYTPHTPVVSIPSMMADLNVDPAGVHKIHALFPGRRLLICIGALVDRHKGQRVLLEAIRLLGDPSIQVCLVGDGIDRAPLQAEASDMANIHFAGFVQNVGDWITAADIVVYPSRTEGLGSTLLDAMQLGRPIIASDTGGIPEIVTHGVSGLLVPPGNAAELAAWIRTLLDDVSLAARLVQGARSRLHEFAVPTVADRIARLYDAVMANSIRAAST